MGLSVKGRIILASMSPRRMELLGFLGIPFETIPSHIEESNEINDDPTAYVLRLAEEKARFVARDFPSSWVIGADTIVVLDGEILGKPSSREEASLMLAKLKGRKHEVFTGLALLQEETGTLLRDVVVSSVYFREIAEEEMRWYVNSDEPYDKAGGYALQGKGAVFVRQLEGSYTNVIGLPLCELVELLKQAGVVEFS